MSLGEYLGAGSGTTKLLLHLNETSGHFIDSSGNGNNTITETDITYSPLGRFGNCASFNGTSSKLVVADNDGLDFVGTTLTMSVWVNPAVSYPTGYIIHKESGAGIRGGYALVQLSTGEIYVNIRNSSNVVIQGNTPAGSLIASVRTNIVGVYNGTDIRIYINGNLAMTPKSCTLTIGATTYGLAIGSTATGTVFFKGLIDEVIIENVAWSAEKIKKYYTMSKGRFGIL